MSGVFNLILVRVCNADAKIIMQPSAL